jgi:hypothetical protein
VYRRLAKRLSTVTHQSNAQRPYSTRRAPSVVHEKHPALGVGGSSTRSPEAKPYRRGKAEMPWLVMPKHRRDLGRRQRSVDDGDDQRCTGHPTQCSERGSQPSASERCATYCAHISDDVPLVDVISPDRQWQRF